MHWLDFHLTLPITDPTWIFFLVLVIILFAPLLLSKLRIPHIIGLILAGLLVGQYGFNVLERDSSFELFGKVGIYYIMFLAGLEMDMGNFERHGKRGLLFGLLTFAIPFGIGLLVSLYVLHFSLLTSLLLACIFSSHTLVAYPVVGRFGVGKHVSVVLSIVATAIASFLALLILAGIVGAHEQGTEPSFWIGFVLKFVLYGAFVIYTFPRIGRRFFRRYDDSVMQYIFVLALVFLSAALAELAGLEGLLGAFLCGLVINSLIPKVSPLMNRIEFVGNALFIPYFLIGVGMIINIRVLFSDTESLWILLVMVLTATLTKWLSAFLMQKLFGMNGDSRRMMFGLTNAHAAGALAMVMIGTQIEIAPGEYLMNDAVLNGTVMVILVSCIISSLATEKAARGIALSDASLEENRGSSHGKCLVSFSNPQTVDMLTQLAMMIRNPRIPDSLVGLSVAYDDAHGEQRLAQGKQNLEKAKKIAAAADVKMTTVSRVSNNIVSGILHTMKEYGVGEVVVGLHHKTTSADSFYGVISENMLKGTHSEVMLVRSIVPPNTWRRIVVAVPPKAEYEVGFYKWLEHLCRMGEQLSCRMHFFAHPETGRYIEAYIRRMHGSVRAEFSELDDWEDLLLLTGYVDDDHLLVIVSARRGFISYDPSFEKLPMQLSKYFSNTSLLLLYPDQYGDPQENVSLFNPSAHTTVRRYEAVAGWIDKWLRRNGKQENKQEEPTKQA
ncbi:MAG: cation:proton antiporter [Bacteroides sp.]|nr:cation:proton antiporter [Bacteroides sp.]